MTLAQSSGTALARQDGKIQSSKPLTSDNSELPVDLASMSRLAPSDAAGQQDDPKYHAHLAALNKKVRSSINQMMKEQRSLSVGNLPGNLKSQILKTMQSDH